MWCIPVTQFNPQDLLLQQRSVKGLLKIQGTEISQLSERHFSSDIPFKSCCVFPPFWESRWEGSHSLLHCPWNFNEYCFGLFQEKLLKSKQSVSQDTTERKNWATQEKCCELKVKNGKKSKGEVFFHIISSMILLLHLFCL